MTAVTLKEINLDRFGHLARRATNDVGPVSILNRDGDVIWSADASAEELLRSILADTDPSVVLLTESTQRSVGSGKLMFSSPVLCEEPEPVGWIILLVDSESDVGDARAVLADVAACMAREVTLNGELDNLASELGERYEELNLIYSLESQGLAVERDPTGAQILLENIAEHLGVDVAALVLSERPTPLFGLNLTRSIPNLDLVLTELRGDLFRFVSTSRSSLILNELEDPRRRYLLINMDFRCLACPVMGGNRVDGMLVLLRHGSRNEFSNGDLKLGKVIANQTAIMMRNRAMLEKLRKFGQQMAGALIEAVEAKDPYTRGHSERVQAISLKIGSAAGLDGDSMEAVAWGSLLHDVGKVGVPDAILCKAGRLTDDEYTMIKIHPERSYEILMHIEDLSPEAREGARYHQENFDGSGYPHGLKGNEIPPTARLISVADTYDAITSSRPYRAGLSHEAAMTEIQRVAGAQLDPHYVTLLERLCEEDHRWLLRITNAHDTSDE